MIPGWAKVPEGHHLLLLHLQHPLWHLCHLLSEADHYIIPQWTSIVYVFLHRLHLLRLLTHRKKCNKKKEKKGSLPPEVRRYFAGEELDDKWICYPWDARDITTHEKIARSGIAAH